MPCDAPVSSAAHCMASSHSARMAQDSWHNGTALQAAEHLCDAASHARSVDIATPECRDGRDTGPGFQADARHCDSPASDSGDRSERRRCSVAAPFPPSAALCSTFPGRPRFSRSRSTSTIPRRGATPS
ncbi:conserved hypothetical protein [Ricinus communis]|uniref:Uncharacterized protein n=1 Tax=Ricinus communis TaxID=3988 RepID=B9T963_RICCO|nr:conserved hypothetical protein [Ricinus communis]